MTRFLLALMILLSLRALPASGAGPSRDGRVTARFLPSQLPPVKAGLRETVALILHADPDSAPRTVEVTLRVPEGTVITPGSRRILLKPGRDVPVFFKLTFHSDRCPASSIAALVDGRNVAELETDAAYDLESIRWKAAHDKEGVGVSQGWMKREFDDSGWSEKTLPSMWNETGVTYLRAKLFVPESWRGKDVYLKIKAIDDNDVCYLNGIEIGRTFGWDKERSYKIAPGIVKFGDDNLLCIAVDNTNAGGGIYRSPNYFGVRFPKDQAKAQVKLAPAGRIGKPMPFRRIVVKNGVLLYEDGGEVALWGANYYPQSWYQFDNMKRLGVDMKKAIRDDLDDMKKMGVQVIRIHVFDREISDRRGNLIDNEHLDLLDYLISEATKRGIYFMFTPIAWWWGPDQNPDSFSAHTPKEFMFCDDPAILAQANYLRNWMNHTNRYTGRKYKDEPAICAFEIMNEPAYADYNSMKDPKACYYPTEPEALAPVKARLNRKWQKWCEANAVEDEPRFFPMFRYELLTRYLDTMYDAIRGTGAKQPIACALFDSTGRQDLISALADSKCEAVTTGAYAGAWDKVGDGVNYLPWAVNEPLSPRLNRKARLVYEFDGIKTFGSYFYPAMARRFRNLGVQICCMFQYDSSTTAEWNTDWDAHYLNWLYTPGKAASFYIGGKVFRDIARGSTFPTKGTTQQFGHCAVSFDRNISIYCDKSTYINSAPYGNWSPLRVPKKPTFIMSVGDSPFAAYSGTGVYTIDVDYTKREASLMVNPDADIVGDPWHPNAAKSAVKLSTRPHRFALKLPGISPRSVVRQSDGDTVELKGNAFDVEQGNYLVVW